MPISAVKDGGFGTYVIKYNKEYDWYEGKAHLDLFNTDIDVIIHNGVDEQYAENCIEQINNPSPSLKNYLTERLYKYYDFMRRECDDAEDISFNDILKHKSQSTNNR